MAAGRTANTRLARLWELIRLVAGEFREHDLFAYASAIAFRGLVALVPLTLLGLALLGAIGLRDVWTDTIAPAIEGRVTPPVYGAIDHSVGRILWSGTAGLITFATALLVWDLFWAVGAVTLALNRIHDVKDNRSARRRVLTRLWLAVVVGCCLIGAALVVLVAPKAVEGALDVLVGLGRWLVAVTLVGLAVGLLVRYAPAEARGHAGPARGRSSSSAPGSSPRSSSASTSARLRISRLRWEASRSSSCSPPTCSRPPRSS